MSFDTVEQSMQSARPAELFLFQAPITSFAITTHERDIIWSGTTYASVASSRSNLVTGDVAGNMSDLVVTMPAGHALPRMYVNGVPPREIAVTATRYDVPTGLFLRLWSGYVSGLSFRGTEASFRIPSGTGDALKSQVPSLVCSRLCQHMLYDDFCTKSRGDIAPPSGGGRAYAQAGTVTAISSDGLTLTISGSPFLTDPLWFAHGEVLHTASTERRTIISCGGAGDAVIQVPFPNGAVTIGDAVTMYAGCDHTPTICRDKFGNILNFGGIPFLPRSNVFYVGLNAANLWSS